MALAPQSVLRTFILVALNDLGGSAMKRSVLDKMDERFGSGLTHGEHPSQPSDDEVQWENQALWESNSMVREGLITRHTAGDTTRGGWTLTPRGRAEAARLVSLIAA